MIIRSLHGATTLECENLLRYLLLLFAVPMFFLFFFFWFVCVGNMNLFPHARYKLRVPILYHREPTLNNQQRSCTV